MCRFYKTFNRCWSHGFHGIWVRTPLLVVIIHYQMCAKFPRQHIWHSHFCYVMSFRLEQISWFGYGQMCVTYFTKLNRWSFSTDDNAHFEWKGHKLLSNRRWQICLTFSCVSKRDRVNYYSRLPTAPPLFTLSLDIQIVGSQVCLWNTKMLGESAWQTYVYISTRRLLLKRAVIRWTYVHHYNWVSRWKYTGSDSKF